MRIVLDLSAEQVADLRRQLNEKSSIRMDELPPASNGLIDANSAAKMLGVGAEYIREHAEELGGVKLGAGQKARWRFDPAKLKSTNAPHVESSSETTAPKRRRRAPRGGALEVRGRKPYV